MCTLMSRRYNTTFKQTKCLDLSCASECMSSGLTHVTRSSCLIGPGDCTRRYHWWDAMLGELS